MTWCVVSPVQSDVAGRGRQPHVRTILRKGGGGDKKREENEYFLERKRGGNIYVGFVKKSLTNLTSVCGCVQEHTRILGCSLSQHVQQRFHAVQSFRQRACFFGGGWAPHVLLGQHSLTAGQDVVQ